MKSISPLFSVSTAKFPLFNFSHKLSSVKFVAPRQRNSPAMQKPSSKSAKTLSVTPTLDPITTTPKKVLVPIGFGTEEMEAVILVDVLRRAGAEVTVASVEQQLEVEAYGGTRLVADTFISTCSDETFDLVALPVSMRFPFRVIAKVAAKEDTTLVVGPFPQTVRIAGAFVLGMPFYLSYISVCSKL